MKIIAAILLFSFIFSACAPSEQAIQTAVAQTQAAYTPTFTPSPIPTDTPAPTATATPDLVFAYFEEFLPHLQRWAVHFQNVNRLNSRIVDEGAAILLDNNFKNELADALANWEATAKAAADVSPPNEDLQRFQEMAEELHIQTETYSNFYVLAMTTGNATSTELAIEALNRAGEIYTQIADEIEKGNYIP